MVLALSSVIASPWALSPSQTSTLLLGTEDCTGLTCRGITTKKKPCKKPINKANVAKTRQIINEIAGGLWSSERIRSLLTQLSYIVMCQGYHQDQAGRKEREWRGHFDVFIQPPSPTKFTVVQPAPYNIAQSVPHSIAQSVPYSTARSTPSSNRSSSFSSPSPTIKSEQDTWPHPITRQSSVLHVKPPSIDTTVFVPYGQKLELRGVNEKIKAILCKPLRSATGRGVTEGPGVVYAYRPDAYPAPYQIHSAGGIVTSTPRAGFPLIKIGHTKTFSRRMKSIATQCGYTPVKCFEPVEVPHRILVESLVMAQLGNKRRQQNFCPKCNTGHREWFEVSVSHAYDVINMWASWVTNKQPYDEQTRQLRPEWARRLVDVNLDDAECWKKFTLLGEDHVGAAVKVEEEVEEHPLWTIPQATQAVNAAARVVQEAPRYGSGDSDMIAALVAALTAGVVAAAARRADTR